MICPTSALSSMKIIIRNKYRLSHYLLSCNRHFLCPGRTIHDIILLCVCVSHNHHEFTSVQSHFSCRTHWAFCETAVGNWRDGWVGYGKGGLVCWHVAFGGQPEVKSSNNHQILVVPVSFISDHFEWVTYNRWIKLNIDLFIVGCLNCHAGFYPLSVSITLPCNSLVSWELKLKMSSKLIQPIIISSLFNSDLARRVLLIPWKSYADPSLIHILWLMPSTGGIKFRPNPVMTLAWICEGSIHIHHRS